MGIEITTSANARPIKYYFHRFVFFLNSKKNNKGWGGSIKLAQFYFF